MHVNAKDKLLRNICELKQRISAAEENINGRLQHVSKKVSSRLDVTCN